MTTRTNKIPTLSSLSKEADRRVKYQGFEYREAFDDVIAELLYMLDQCSRAAKEWEEAHDKLKLKYEPEPAEVNREGNENKN